MHLGRHLRAIHRREPAAGKGAPEAA
jgi:hypothetical protein